MDLLGFLALHAHVCLSSILDMWACWHCLSGICGHADIACPAYVGMLTLLVRHMWARSEQKLPARPSSWWSARQGPSSGCLPA